MTRRKQPTWTSLVEEALRARDDFATLADLMQATGGSYNQVHAALWKLREHRAVGVEITADGKGWWYARPQEEDIRHWHVEERTPEDKPRRTRKPKATPTGETK